MSGIAQCTHSFHLPASRVFFSFFFQNSMQGKITFFHLTTCRLNSQKQLRERERERVVNRNTVRKERSIIIQETLIVVLRLL